MTRVLIHKPRRNRQSWEPIDIDLLIELWPNHTCNEVALLMNRSYWSVCTMAANLRIHKTAKHLAKNGPRSYAKAMANKEKKSGDRPFKP